MNNNRRLRPGLIALLICCLLLTGCSAKSSVETIVTPDVMEVTPQAPPTPTPAPTPSPEPDPFRFVVAGDSRGLYKDEVGKYQGEPGGINTAVVSRMFEALSRLELPPRFVMTLGDYGMGSSDAAEAKTQYQTFLDTAAQFFPKSAIYACYGNHEALCKDGGIEVFSEVFSDFIADNFCKPEKYGRTVYHFSANNCNFFVLNTNSPDAAHSIPDDVLEWLQYFTGNGDAFNFIFIHEPAFPSGNHVGNSLDKNPKQRNKFWSVVDNIPGAIVFNAHEHQYARRRIDRSFTDQNGNPYVNEVYQITTAGMGAPFP